MGTGSFPRVNSGRSVLLTTHTHLVPQSWKSTAIPLPHPLGHTGPVTGSLYICLLYMLDTTLHYLMTPLNGPITIITIIVIIIIVFFPYSLFLIIFSLYGWNVSDGTWYAVIQHFCIIFGIFTLEYQKVTGCVLKFFEFLSQPSL